ncbi:MAG: hypothetical protein MI746_00745 [Pseudomonadales bacterium]|nr:hypothetical protein [Pseudomonadales bacterium]
MVNNESQHKLQRIRRRRLLVVNTYLMLKRGTRYIPPIARAILGVLLVVLGVLGFLPVLGFWMIPLGLALIATDIPPMARWIKRKLDEWRRHHLAEHHAYSTDRTESKD